jgi:hypothetical protein
MKPGGRNQMKKINLSFGSPAFSIFTYSFIIVLLFREFIFSNEMLFGTDTIEAGVMFRAFLAEHFRQYLEVPLWNPYLFGGMPFVDAMHGDTFFPLSFIQFILPIHRALGWKLVLAALAGGIITYYYFRSLKFSPGICFWGGLLYLLNGFTISLVYAGHDGRMYISILLPLLFMAIDRIFKSAKLSSLFFWSLSFSLLVLANHPQLAYFAMWGVGAYVVYRLIQTLRESGGVKKASVVSTFIIVGIIIGLAGSMVQLLSQYIYVNKYSPRAEGGRGYEYSASWSNHPEEIIGLVNPSFCGVNAGNHNDYWGRNVFKLNSDYAGFIPLLFALVAVIFFRKSNTYFFLGLAIFAILYGLGDHTPLFKLFYYLVPSVKSFRAPSTVMFLYVFSIVYLAVHGMKYIIDNIKDKKITVKISKTLLVTSIIVSAFTLIFSINPRGMLEIYNSILYSSIDSAKLATQAAAASSVRNGFLLISFFSWMIFLLFRLYKNKTISVTLFISLVALLSLIDLWLEGSKFIQTTSFDRYFRKERVVDFLRNQEGDYRVLSFPQTFTNQNYLALYDIPQVFGYHGNELKRYDEYSLRNWLQSARSNREYQQRYRDFLYGRRFDLMSIGYLAAPADINDYKFQPVFSSGRVHINKNKLALPRARIVYNYEVILDPDSAVARVDQDDFDYRNSVVLDKEPNKTVPKDSAVYVTAEITNNEINRFDIIANTPNPGILVISDNYYPAWKATVDGDPAEILMADGNFMAVALEAGDHMVHIEFDSVYYNASSTTTKLVWILYIGIIIYFPVKKYILKK